MSNEILDEVKVAMDLVVPIVHSERESTVDHIII